MKRNDFEEHQINRVYVSMIILMLVFISFVICLIYFVNSSKSGSKGYELAKKQAEDKKGVQTVTNVEEDNSRKLTSDELDIWTLPPTGRKSSENNGTVSTDTGNVKKDSSEPEEKVIETEPLQGIDKDTYYSFEFEKDGDLLKYLNNGIEASSQGIEISYKQGNVNFKRLKNAGFDFVYLHLGKRGYSSGNIIIDENFNKNFEAALSSGIKTGVIFTTWAVNKDEIIEEADVVITSISGKQLTYPVVLNFEEIEDDLTRTDGLSKTDRTDLILYFIKEVKASGYEVCLYGSDDFFENKINLEELENVQIWLRDEGDCPNYEGTLNFWNYGKGHINGISGEATLSIHFD